MADTPTKMPEIVIDHRELRSPVAKTLERLGVKLVFKTLEVGDYVVSDRIAFERKTMDDLFSSWLDEKKLFEQLYDLAQAYHRPVLIIEGGDPFFTTRRVNVQAIRGMLNAITVSLRVPILYSLTAVETAQHLLLVALKEQNKDGRSISVHGKRSHMGIDRQREYIVSAVTDVGPVAAKNLLSYFGSVENVMKASPEELGNVKLIGPITAEHIRKVVSGKYADGGGNSNKEVREDVSIQQGAEKFPGQLWV
jgi:Fanconi anemia group M protein